MLSCFDTSKQILKPRADVLVPLPLLCQSDASTASCSPAFTLQAPGCFGLVTCSLTSFFLWTCCHGSSLRAASLSPAPVCLVILRQEKSRQIPAFQEALWQEEEKRACARLRGSQTEAQPLLWQHLQRHLLLRWRGKRWSEVSTQGCYQPCKYKACSPCF